MATNLEAAAEAYAREQERKYVVKRGGSVPWRAALSVYLAAFSAFVADPDRIAA